MSRHGALKFAKTPALAADGQRQTTSLKYKFTLSSNLSRAQGNTPNSVPVNVSTGTLPKKNEDVTFHDAFDLRCAQEIKQPSWQSSVPIQNQQEYYGL